MIIQTCTFKPGFMFIFDILQFHEIYLQRLYGSRKWHERFSKKTVPFYGKLSTWWSLSPSVTNDHGTKAIPKSDLYGKMSYSTWEKYLIELSYNVHYETTGKLHRQCHCCRIYVKSGYLCDVLQRNKGYKAYFAMKKYLEQESLQLIEETMLNPVDTLINDLVTSLNDERTSISIIRQTSTTDSLQ